MKTAEKPKMKYREALKIWECHGDGCVYISGIPEKAYLGHHNKCAYVKRLRLVK
jgi:hypothetical protein